MVDKKTVSSQLKEAANLLELLAEDPFRARAFQSAARQLESFEGDFEQLFVARQLTSIKGIGKGLAEELYSLGENALIPALSDLRKRVPEGVRSLFRVSGLGAKKIAALWAIDIDSLAELVAAAQDGRIAKLKGFGEKSAEKILVAARFALEAQKQLRLDQAEALVELIFRAVGIALPDCQLKPVGRYRRGLETVADLSFIVTNVASAELMNVLSELGGVESNGDELRLHLAGRDIHFSLVEQTGFAAALLYHTGSDDYWQALSQRAETFGYRLTRTGLFQGEKLVEVASEEDVLQRLNLPYIIPERRECAAPVALSEIIRLEDIRGLIHNHSTWSDAVHSIPEMIGAAKERGFAYLAMADHSQSSYYANGLSIERVLAQAQEIAELRRGLQDGFELLHGIEVDILTDGSLDYPDEVLASLDYTVVSVHQNFTLSRSKQTERIIKAVHHPSASILGHASGRLLLRRPPYEVDLQEVIEACAQTATVIEINASPYRLDLDWRWVIKAKELGCRFSINPDAHSTAGFDDLKYGVIMARKAGLCRSDVVNTAPTAQAFLKMLKP